MNLKKIVIYENKFLFNILDEIKEEFNFKLINANVEDFKEIKRKHENSFLLISYKEILDHKNQLILNNKPIKINKLIELINLEFLKDKFKSQSDISIGSYKLNLNSREISKNNKIINLTEREVNLILFLKKESHPVKINELQKQVWDYNLELETHTVETHIYRLRKKIKEKFNDDNFIVSSKKGYLIN